MPRFEASIAALELNWTGLWFLMGGFALVIAAVWTAPGPWPYHVTRESQVVFDGTTAWAGFVVVLFAYPARLVKSKRTDRAGWAVDGAVAALTLGSLLTAEDVAYKALGTVGFLLGGSALFLGQAWIIERSRRPNATV